MLDAVRSMFAKFSNNKSSGKDSAGTLVGGRLYLNGWRKLARLVMTDAAQVDVTYDHLIQAQQEMGDAMDGVSFDTFLLKVYGDCMLWMDVTIVAKHVVLDLLRSSTLVPAGCSGLFGNPGSSYQKIKS